MSEITFRRYLRFVDVAPCFPLHFHGLQPWDDSFRCFTAHHKALRLKHAKLLAKSHLVSWLSDMDRPYVFYAYRTERQSAMSPRILEIKRTS